MRDVLLLIQVVLCTLLLIFLFIAFFIPELFLLVKIILIMLLLDMAFNNFKIYDRKYFTIIYIISALLVGILM